jgi:hypothetical protein
MLRRFEMYALRDSVGDDERQALAGVLRNTGRYIPEVLDSATGWNAAEADIDLVWEHSYESAASYARYMRHPFHICILDRYLLPESPECLTESRGSLQVGLMGYEIDEPRFRATAGVRRIVALAVSPGVSPADMAALSDRLERRRDEVDGMSVSVVAANVMGLEWFPTGWTHVWEQAYDDEAAVEKATADETTVLGAPVERSVTVHYRIDGGAP